MCAMKTENHTFSRATYVKVVSSSGARQSTSIEIHVDQCVSIKWVHEDVENLYLKCLKSAFSLDLLGGSRSPLHKDIEPYKAGVPKICRDKRFEPFTKKKNRRQLMTHRAAARLLDGNRRLGRTNRP